MLQLLLCEVIWYSCDLFGNWGASKSEEKSKSWFPAEIPFYGHMQTWVSVARQSFIKPLQTSVCLLVWQNCPNCLFGHFLYKLQIRFHLLVALHCKATNKGKFVNLKFTNFRLPSCLLVYPTYDSVYLLVLTHQRDFISVRDIWVRYYMFVCGTNESENGNTIWFRFDSIIFWKDFLLNSEVS